MPCFVNIIRKMDLLQTLFPSASHCIKCFCNFIRILCLCRCQSAVKLKCKQKYYIFIHSGNWESPFFWQAKQWQDPLDRVILWGRRQFWTWILKARRNGAWHFRWHSLAIWSTKILHQVWKENFWVFLSPTHYSFFPFFFFSEWIKVALERLPFLRGVDISTKC